MPDRQQTEPKHSWRSPVARLLGGWRGWVLLVMLMLVVLVALAIAGRETPRWAVLAILVLLAIALVGLVIALVVAVRHHRAWPAFWREYVRANADLIGNEVRTLRVDHPVDHPAVGAIEQHLEVARMATERPGDDDVPLFRRFLDWWTGASIEAAFLNLHAAEVLLVELLSEEQIRARIPDVLAHVQKLEVGDHHRLAVERLRLDDSKLPEAVRRVAYANALRWHYETADLQHARVRSFRNVIIAVTVLLTVLTVIVGIVGAGDPEAIPSASTRRRPRPSRPRPRCRRRQLLTTTRSRTRQRPRPSRRRRRQLPTTRMSRSRQRPRWVCRRVPRGSQRAPDPGTWPW